MYSNNPYLTPEERAEAPKQQGYYSSGLSLKNNSQSTGYNQIDRNPIISIRDQKEEEEEEELDWGLESERKRAEEEIFGTQYGFKATKREAYEGRMDYEIDEKNGEMVLKSYRNRGQLYGDKNCDIQNRCFDARDEYHDFCKPCVKSSDKATNGIFGKFFCCY